MITITQINIMLCDLCGKPYEMGSQMHGGEFRATIFQKNFKIYDIIFNVCLGCCKSSGLYKIFKEMEKKQSKNKNVVKFSKIHLSKTQRIEFKR